MLPYTGDYIEHIDSTTNYFRYYTFAPRPLMNGNMYQMDDELATLLTEAHRNIGFLEGLIQFAPNRDPFTELILLKECTYSRMIDYTGPNFKDVLTICGTGKGDISPIMNLKSAYRTAMTMEIAAPNLSRICGIALNGDEEADSIGVRDHQTFWLGAKTNLRGYNPTEPDAVLPALADISAYLYNSGEDPLIQAALVHYQFEMIHPFEKYNGVVGRILPFMVLRKIVGNALPVLCLSEHLLLNKNEYFDMLRTTQYSGGYVRWIKFFIQIINEAARNSVALLKKYEETIKLDEERLRNAMPQTNTFWNVYEYIKAFPVTSMATFIEKNHMTTAEGFKRGNRKHQCNAFKGLPLVEAKSFKPYYVSSDELPVVDFDNFECIVKNSREIFVAPHLIIKQSHKNGTFLSEVLDYDAAFNHSLLGVHGNINKLKYLSVIIGSRVFSYYHILTNRKWLVERDELEAGDIWQTPIPSPSDAEVTEACEIFDELAISPAKKEKAEQFVRHMYRLKEYESYQIDDVIDYVYDYFKKKQHSVSFERPNSDAYKQYYYSISEVLTNTFGASAGLTGDLYFGDAPLSVLVLNIGRQNDTNLNIVKNNDRLNEILLSLDSALVDSQQMVFIRRNLRIYQPDRIFIIKPSQRKYWTYSAACRDADEIFEDVSKAWR